MSKSLIRQPLGNFLMKSRIADCRMAILPLLLDLSCLANVGNEGLLTVGNSANDSANQSEDAINGSTNGNGNGNGLASAIRQSAILEKIRQSENRQAPLKEILAAFPEVSERTMRYDLQKLCGQDVIERVGNGGPGSYYTIK